MKWLWCDRSGGVGYVMLQWYCQRLWCGGGGVDFGFDVDIVVAMGCDASGDDDCGRPFCGGGVLRWRR